MVAIILRILTSVLGASAVSWLSSNLMVIGIAGAALLVTNLVGGVYWYVDGYNSAAAKCQVATIKRERDELKRDRDVQKSSADFYQTEAARLQKREDDRNEKGAQDATGFKHVDGCVVPKRVRNTRPQR